VPEITSEASDDLRVAALASLAGLESDAAPVFVDLQWGTYLLAVSWLVRYPWLFRPLHSMNHAAVRTKREVARELVLHTAHVTTTAARAAQGLPPEVINRAPPEITTESLLQHPWIWPYAISFDAATFDGSSELALAVRGLLASIRPDACAALFDAIGDAEAHARLERLVRGVVEGAGSGALGELMEALRGSDETVVRAYPLIAATSDLIERSGQRAYPAFAGERDRLLAQAATSLSRVVTIDRPPRRRRGRVVFLLSRLEAALHAPTRTIASYVNELRARSREVEATLVVTDDRTAAPFELLVEGLSSFAPSSLFREDHAALMPDVPIHYSDPGALRGERVRRDLEVVVAVEPDVVVVFGAETSLLRPLIFPHYPVLYLSSGGGRAAGFCDVFAGPDSPDAAARLFSEAGLPLPGALVQHRVGFDFPAPLRAVSRADLGLSASDFVVCTSGLRLDAELAADFADLMDHFLRDHARARWLVVGGSELRPLRSRPALWERVRHVALDANLPALFACADAYANPFRRGDRQVLAMAMNSGLPVISLRSSSDAAVILGGVGGVADARAYAEELDRMHDDDAYRRAMGAASQARARSVLSWESAVRGLIALIDQTRTASSVRTRRRSQRSAA
jgi:hypothetical protein